MATIIDLVNSINASASNDYQTRIPLATRDNITSVGNALLTYSASKEEFTNTLINKIAMTIVNSKMAKNKLALFKKGTMEYGDTIEEVFVDILTANNFDGTATDVFTKASANVDAIYHKQDRKLQYTVSVSDNQIKTAFKSEANLRKFVEAIVNSLYSSRFHDEYIMTKELLGTYKNGAIVQVDSITTQATALDFLQKIKQIIRNLTYMSTHYNKKGVTTFTDEGNQVLLIDKDVMSVIEKHMSGVFNMSTVLPNIQVIEVDDFGSYTGRYAMIVDKEAVKIYDTLSTTESIRNPKGMYTNYFVNLWALYSISLFNNVVSFELATSDDLADATTDTTVTD